MLKKFFATAAFALLMLSPFAVSAQETVTQTGVVPVSAQEQATEGVTYNEAAAFAQQNGFLDENGESLADSNMQNTIYAMMAGMGVVLLFAFIPLIAILVYILVTFIKIAQKTHTPNGWLVITLFAIPFKVAKFAGFSYWYGLIAFASLPFYLIDERLASIVALGVIGFFTYLWMRVCKRLGFSQWLGLLMIVPIANLVLPGVLAFSKNQLVENTQF